MTYLWVDFILAVTAIRFARLLAEDGNVTFRNLDPEGTEKLWRARVTYDTDLNHLVQVVSKLTPVSGHLFALT